MYYDWQHSFAQYAFIYIYVYILLQICSLHFPWCFVFNCSLPFSRTAEHHWFPSTTKRTNWPTNFWHIGQTIPFPTQKNSTSTHSGHDCLTCLTPLLHSSPDHSYSHRDCEHMLSPKNPNKTSAFCFSICANTQPKYYQSKV